MNLLKKVLNFGAVGLARVNDPVTRNLSLKTTTRTMKASATVSVDHGCNTFTDLNLALGNVFATLLAPAVLQLLKLLWRGLLVFIVCGRGRLGAACSFVWECQVAEREASCFLCARRSTARL